MKKGNDENRISSKFLLIRVYLHLILVILQTIQYSWTKAKIANVNYLYVCIVYEHRQQLCMCFITRCIGDFGSRILVTCLPAKYRNYRKTEFRTEIHKAPRLGRAIKCFTPWDRDFKSREWVTYWTFMLKLYRIVLNKYRSVI